MVSVWLWSFTIVSGSGSCLPPSPHQLGVGTCSLIVFSHLCCITPLISLYLFPSVSPSPCRFVESAGLFFCLACFQHVQFLLKLQLCLVNPAKKQPYTPAEVRTPPLGVIRTVSVPLEWRILCLEALFLRRPALAGLCCSRSATISAIWNIWILNLHKSDQRLLCSRVEGNPALVWNTETK